mmetsp:Transcript_15443/g.45160  ORF Transcript_15443/g.45160 Transcript_15443/m.45160 type:complete len:325 (-) Transcript_15443:18-992(-)
MALLEGAKTRDDAQPLVGDPKDELPGREAEPAREEALVEREEALVLHRLDPAVEGALVHELAVGAWLLVHDARLGNVRRRGTEGSHEARAECGEEVAAEVLPRQAEVVGDEALGRVVRCELAEVNEGSPLDGRGGALVEAKDALLRLNLCEGIHEPVVPRLIQLARGDEAAVALHAHLDQVAGHGDRLSHAARGHAGGRLGQEGRLGRILAAKGLADVFVSDSAETRVRDVPRERRREALVEAADTLRLNDVAHHAKEGKFGAREANLALELQARLCEVDGVGRALRAHGGCAREDKLGRDLQHLVPITRRRLGHSHSCCGVFV